MANKEAYKNGKESRFRAGKEQAKTAKKGWEKSAEVRHYNSIARNALKAHLDDEELDKQITALLSRGRQGNLTAIKMIFEYTEPLADKEETQTEEINLAYLAPVLPEEEPPEEGDAN